MFFFAALLSATFHSYQHSLCGWCLDRLRFVRSIETKTKKKWGRYFIHHTQNKSCPINRFWTCECILCIHKIKWHLWRALNFTHSSGNQQPQYIYHIAGFLCVIWRVIIGRSPLFFSHTHTQNYLNRDINFGWLKHKKKSFHYLYVL